MEMKKEKSELERIEELENRVRELNIIIKKLIEYKVDKPPKYSDYYIDHGYYTHDYSPTED